MTLSHSYRLSVFACLGNPSVTRRRLPIVAMCFCFGFLPPTGGVRGNKRSALPITSRSDRNQNSEGRRNMKRKRENGNGVSIPEGTRLHRGHGEVPRVEGGSECADCLSPVPRVTGNGMNSECSCRCRRDFRAPSSFRRGSLGSSLSRCFCMRRA